MVYNAGDWKADAQKLSENLCPTFKVIVLNGNALVSYWRYCRMGYSMFLKYYCNCAYKSLRLISYFIKTPDFQIHETVYIQVARIHLTCALNIGFCV